jgi:hypothetical protein
MDKKPKTVDIFNSIMMNFTDPDAMEFFDKAFDEEMKKSPEKGKENETPNKS